MDINETAAEEKKLQDEMRFNGVLILTYSITYPELTQGESRERINAYYSLRAKRKENQIRGRLYRESVNRYKKSVASQIPYFETQYISEFAVSLLNNTFFSLYQDDYEFLGGANGQTFRTSQTWYLPKGRRVRLADFFRPKVHWRKIMIDYISDTIKKQLEDDSGMYFDNWELLIRRYFNPNNYYLARDGFVIYYQETTIAPHASGIVNFTIPFNLFQGGLTFNIENY